jgi:hypothetical protein
MNRLTIVVSGLLGMFVTASAAQEPNRSIDLDVVSNSPFPSIVVARVSFAETDDQCPQDRAMLRISGGTLALNRPMPNYPAPTSTWRGTMQAADDETQRYRAETSTCRMDVAVRQQVRRDESWEALLVPRLQRTSLPPEERRELQRQFRAPMPSAQGMAAIKELLPWQGLGSFPWSFYFEDRPETCFEAVGDFDIERLGLRFSFLISFLTGLPGDLNRFVIERTDLDMNHGRLYFARGECRFELTVSQSVLRDGEWISVPLASAAPQKH